MDFNLFVNSVIIMWKTQTNEKSDKVDVGMLLLGDHHLVRHFTVGALRYFSLAPDIEIKSILGWHRIV